MYFLSCQIYLLYLEGNEFWVFNPGPARKKFLDIGELGCHSRSEIIPRSWTVYITRDPEEAGGTEHAKRFSATGYFGRHERLLDIM